MGNAAFECGSFVRTWFDTGAGNTGGPQILYGVVVASGPKAFTVRWPSGARNRIDRSALRGIEPARENERLEALYLLDLRHAARWWTWREGVDLSADLDPLDQQDSHFQDGFATIDEALRYAAFHALGRGGSRAWDALKLVRDTATGELEWIAAKTHMEHGRTTPT